MLVNGETVRISKEVIVDYLKADLIRLIYQKAVCC